MCRDLKLSFVQGFSCAGDLGMVSHGLLKPGMTGEAAGRLARADGAQSWAARDACVQSHA